MHFVYKERRGLQRRSTESPYPRPSNERKKESHEVAEEKLPISTSRTLRTSKLNGFINTARGPAEEPLGKLGSLIGYRV